MATVQTTVTTQTVQTKNHQHRRRWHGMRLYDDGGESSACVLGIYRYFHGVARLYSYIFKQRATAWH